jgi:hypothetical protein
MGIVADVRLVGALLPISVTLEELDEMMLAMYIVSTVTSETAEGSHTSWKQQSQDAGYGDFGPM